MSFTSNLSLSLQWVISRECWPSVVTGRFIICLRFLAWPIDNQSWGNYRLKLPEFLLWEKCSRKNRKYNDEFGKIFMVSKWVTKSRCCTTFQWCYKTVDYAIYSGSVSSLWPEIHFCSSLLAITSFPFQFLSWLLRKLPMESGIGKPRLVSKSPSPIKVCTNFGF